MSNKANQRDTFNLFGEKIKNKRIIPKAPKGSIPYFPSNGTEGAYFELNNCDVCTKKRNCTILIKAYIGKEPKQWVTTVDGEDICISLKKR